MKVKMRILLAAIAVGITLEVQATDVTMSADVVSSYIFRGVTLSDSAVLQPSMELDLPIVLGIWGNLNFDDYTPDTSGQFTEVDLYANYALPLNIEPFIMTIGYTEYLYPSSAAGGDADREINAAFLLDAVLSPTLTIYYGVDGAIERTFYAELELSHSVNISDVVNCEFSCTGAYAYPDKGKRGFSNATIGFDLNYNLFHLGATYIAQLDDKVLSDAIFDEHGNPTSLGYDKEFIVSAGISKTF